MSASPLARSARLIPFCLLLLPSLLLAADAAKVKALLDQSGFTEQVQALPALIRSEIRQHGEITEDNLDLILTRADSEVLVNRLEASVQTSVAEALSEEDLTTLSNWYDSELGQRVTGEEVQAASTASLKDMETQADTLLEDQERLAQIRELDRLTATTDNAVALHHYSATAVASAIPGNDSGEPPAAPAGMEPLNGDTPAELRQQVETRHNLVFLYAYRNLDDSSLEQYQAFLASEPAQRFYQAIHQGMTSALTDEVDAWAQQLRDAMSVIEAD